MHKALTSQNILYILIAAITMRNTQRYAKHAPYYQFIIWAQQISVLILISAIESTEALVLISLAVCALALYAQIRIQPHMYEFQNKMEKWLLMTICVIISTAYIYSEILRDLIQNDSSNPLTWIFSFIFLVAMFGSLLVASIYFRLWRKLWFLLQQMWNDRNRQSISVNAGDQYNLIGDEDGNGIIGEEVSASGSLILSKTRTIDQLRHADQSKIAKLEASNEKLENRVEFLESELATLKDNLESIKTTLGI